VLPGYGWFRAQGELVQIGAGAKVLPLTGEDDGPDVRILAKLLETVAQRLSCVLSQDVQRLAAHGDQRDRPEALDDDLPPTARLHVRGHESSSSPRMVPFSSNIPISSAGTPSSPRTSTVCSPNIGGGYRYRAGVP